LNVRRNRFPNATEQFRRSPQNKKSRLGFLGPLSLQPIATEDEI